MIDLTPLYDNAAIKASNSVSYEFVKVTFPLFYEVSKDNKTHYVLGIAHPIPLSALPNDVLEKIQNCEILLTEGMSKIPQAIQQILIKESSYYPPDRNFFLDAIKSKDKFKKDMQKILKVVSIEQNLENISPILLYQLFFSYLSKRLDPEQLRIEEELIASFKRSNKSIVELNEKTVNQECFNSLLIVENGIKNSLSKNTYFEQYKAKNALLSFSEKVNEYYEEPLKFMEENITSSTLKKFFEDDLNKTSVNLGKENAELNYDWINIFENAHQQNKGPLLFVCGYGHLLDNNASILFLLKEKKFSVDLVNRFEKTQKLTSLSKVL